MTNSNYSWVKGGGGAGAAASLQAIASSQPNPTFISRPSITAVDASVLE